MPSRYMWEWWRIAIYETIFSDFMYKATYCSADTIVLCFWYQTEVLPVDNIASCLLHETLNPFPYQLAVELKQSSNFFPTCCCSEWIFFWYQNNWVKPFKPLMFMKRYLENKCGWRRTRWYTHKRLVLWSELPREEKKVSSWKFKSQSYLVQI